jgi:large subunit ribosomal protein L10
MDGQAVSADDIRAIAKLPSREVLYAQLVGTVAAPLNGLARTLNALISGIAVQLGQIRDQGLVGGSAAPAKPEAPAAEAEAPAEEAPAEEAPAEEAPAEEAPTETAEEPAAEAEVETDTDTTTENQTDAAADADDASDAKED